MEEIAEVYARALFEVAKEDDVLDRVHDELGEFADALDEDRNLQVFLFSPYFSSEEKKDGVRRIVSDADERLVNFLELLAERHRMPVLFRIRRIFDCALGRGEQAAAGDRDQRRPSSTTASSRRSASGSRSRPAGRSSCPRRSTPTCSGA